MKKIRFIEDELAGDVFYSEEDPKPKSAGLWLFGLPQFVGPNEVTRAYVETGVVSFQPHYIGTYDSGGIFSPVGIHRTCRKSQELFDRGYVMQINNQKPFHLPPLEFCVGHSFGSLVALRGVQYLHTLKVLFLMGPTVHYRRSNPDFGNKADGPKILDQVRKSNPKTYRVASSEEWDEIMSGREPLPRLNDHPSLQEVVVVVGERDNYVDIGALEKNLPILVEAFCGKSIKYSFVVVPEGGHTIDYLVNAGNHFKLSEVLLRYITQ